MSAVYINKGALAFQSANKIFLSRFTQPKLQVAKEREIGFLVERGEMIFVALSFAASNCALD